MPDCYISLHDSAHHDDGTIQHLRSLYKHATKHHQQRTQLNRLAFKGVHDERDFALFSL